MTPWKQLFFVGRFAFSREFPAISTIQTFAKGCHRFIGTSRLCLAVADLSLITLSTLQTRTHGLDFLSDHRFIHVLLCNSLFLGSLLFTFHLLVGEIDELFWCDFPSEDAVAKTGIGFVFQILK